MVTLKKGGRARWVVTSVLDGDMCEVPKGFVIDAIEVYEVEAGGGNFAIGTTVGGVDVVASVALSGVAETFTPLTPLVTFFSMTEDTPLYLSLNTDTKVNAVVHLRKVS